MLVEFDKLKRVREIIIVIPSAIFIRLLTSSQDYQEHQNEIHSKLVAIMGDRLNAHIKSFKVSSLPLFNHLSQLTRSLMFEF
jgi:hypothetical protein